MEHEQRLPAEIRRCPACAAGEMSATRAGLGGGWGGAGLRFVFSCKSCGHEKVIDGRRTRMMEAAAGVILLVICVITAPLVADALGWLSMLVIGAFSMVAVFVIASALMMNRRYRVVGTKADTECATAVVEDRLYLSDKDIAQGEVWDRRGAVVIYAIVAATALWLLAAFLRNGW